ncbi:sigma-70 family RNA polymerase sigma factor [Amycolatopsis regifaucium]|uniref:RNA polymerase subunit sigma-70 n=1 Tax=Amycolatopsis regifaucium TaxID=546365 RepID=A0A154MBC6_9PSEU|nr:sigma-70 family RNA polymerase sigma factor [Amycolatopsis regifaucium]KZB81885.1 RNA polymerase subunit sigma-70 [Amycolatopsis regifaucium]OKA06045.1 RNA polymerase subunit sigma-70 [Amycolatopsis regifaucium]SFG75536.1 RNA polymerase sigma-70 factor, ECF subfamily [Amycolatopsis regifaucium]
MTLPAPSPVSMLAGHILRRSGLSPAPSPRQADETTEETNAAAEAAKAEAWDLVSAAQGGDTSAFGRLYDRYVDVVYRYVLFRLGDRDLAEDVTSETFLRALRRITSVSYQGRDVGAWFVTIARNIILDHVKSSRFRLEVVTDEVAEPSGAPIGNVGVQAVAGPEQQAISRATRAELLRCVAELGEDQRECIVLRFMQGLSVAETAAIMRRNEGAIKALQHRAVRRLAQLLPTGLR